MQLMVAVLVGGWTAVCLTDLVLKVTTLGLRHKPTVPRVGAQGPRPFLFPNLHWRQVAGSHVRPSVE